MEGSSACWETRTSQRSARVVSRVPKKRTKRWVIVFLTFSLFHFTQSEVLGSDDWVKGLHVRGVDAHRVLSWALLGWQGSLGFIRAVADKSRKQINQVTVLTPLTSQDSKVDCTLDYLELSHLHVFCNATCHFHDFIPHFSIKIKGNWTNTSSPYEKQRQTVMSNTIHLPNVLRDSPSFTSAGFNSQGKRKAAAAGSIFLKQKNKSTQPSGS